jgi:2-oxoglutarate dehydrogenase E2 component (dihydrolipoamide succinyltransferase)
MENQDTATAEAPAAQDASTSPAPEATPAPQASGNQTPEAAPAPQADAAPVEPPAPAEQPTPEQVARQRAQAAQKAIDAMISEREDKAAAEIRAVCAKYGVDLVVGHSVKIQFNRGAQKV